MFSQEIRDFGLLQKLVAMITDIQPTLDDDKKLKKEKTAVSRGGKKSRTDEEGVCILCIFLECSLYRANTQTGKITVTRRPPI